MISASAPPKVPWAVVLGGGAIVFLSIGTRQSFGIFLRAITEELGTGRESFSIAIAILNLMMGVPVAGFLADRFGYRWVMLSGAGIYAAAMLGVSRMQSEAGMVIFLGLLAGIGLSGLSLAVILSAVGSLVPVSRRSSLLGLVTAGTSLGMFVLVPAAQFGLDTVGWRTSFVLMALTMVIAAGFSFVFPKSRDGVATSEDVVDEPFVDVMRKARSNRSYLLLVVGFFVCGFHVAFIATHLPAFLADGGVSGGAASLSLAMIGLMNMVGSLTFGRLGDHFRKRTLLSILYGTRSLLMVLLLVVPLNSVTSVAFGASIGFVWLATAPLTSSTVAQLLGARYLATLYGVVFFAHQIGAFLGVWLGGRIFDSTGSYTAVWQISIALGIAAMFIHLPIDDRVPPTRKTVTPEGASA